jgi:hypothetical protein
VRVYYLLNIGGIYVSGLNLEGHIGLGSKWDCHCVPEITKIDKLRNIVGASFGFWHTGVINKEGIILYFLFLLLFD